MMVDVSILELHCCTAIHIRGICVTTTLKLQVHSITFAYHVVTIIANCVGYKFACKQVTEKLGYIPIKTTGKQL